MAKLNYPTIFTVQCGTMIKTAEEYKNFVSDLKGRLTDTWEQVPESERPQRALKVAAALTLSQTTIHNYFGGAGTNPETALSILEKYNEIYSETN